MILILNLNITVLKRLLLKLWMTLLSTFEKLWPITGISANNHKIFILRINILFELNRVYLN